MGLFAPCFKADLPSAVVKSTLQSQRVLMFVSRPTQADNQLGECFIIAPADMGVMRGVKGRGSLTLCMVHTALIREELAGMLQLGERDVPRADSHRLRLPPFPRQPKGAGAKVISCRELG